MHSIITNADLQKNANFRNVLQYIFKKNTVFLFHFVWLEPKPVRKMLSSYCHYALPLTECDSLILHRNMYQLVTVNAQEVDRRSLKIFRGSPVRRLKQGREIHH